MFSTSSGSTLAPPPNQASRISPSSASEVARKLSASTLASFQRRAPLAVAASAAQGCPDARHLVGRDRGTRPGPAGHDRLFGPAVGDVAGGRLARPCPVRALGIGVGAVEHGLMAAPTQLLGQRARHAGQLVGRNRYPHRGRVRRPRSLARAPRPSRSPRASRRSRPAATVNRMRACPRSAGPARAPCR